MDSVWKVSADAAPNSRAKFRELDLNFKEGAACIR